MWKKKSVQFIVIHLKYYKKIESFCVKFAIGACDFRKSEISRVLIGLGRLSFTKPWRTRFNFTEGSMVMSAPAKSLFYWGIENLQPGGRSNNSGSVLIASYSDD